MSPAHPASRPGAPSPVPWALVALFAASGALHFAIPAFFVAMVPRWLPAPLALVYISGACELAGAAGLVARPTRRAAGWGLIALLVMVFPANVEMLRAAHATGAPAWYQTLLWLRLPLQPLLAWWTWTVAARGARTAA